MDPSQSVFANRASSVLSSGIVVEPANTLSRDLDSCRTKTVTDVVLRSARFDGHGLSHIGGSRLDSLSFSTSSFSRNST